MVGPGPFDTERAQALFRAAAARADVSIEEAVQRSGLRARIDQTGEPDGPGAVIAFLCSVPASFLTGAVVLVDGGAA